MEAVLIKYYQSPLAQVIDDRYMQRLVYMVGNKGLTRRALRNRLEKITLVNNDLATQEYAYIQTYFDYLLNLAVDLGYIYSRRIPRNRPLIVDVVLHRDELMNTVSKI